MGRAHLLWLELIYFKKNRILVNCSFFKLFYALKRISIFVVASNPFIEIKYCPKWPSSIFSSNWRFFPLVITYVIFSNKKKL